MENKFDIERAQRQDPESISKTAEVLAAKLRSGELSENRIKCLAWLGYKPARHLINYTGSDVSLYGILLQLKELDSDMNERPFYTGSFKFLIEVLRILIDQYPSNTPYSLEAFEYLKIISSDPDNFIKANYRGRLLSHIRDSLVGFVNLASFTMYDILSNLIFDDESENVFSQSKEQYFLRINAWVREMDDILKIGKEQLMIDFLLK